jgi:hypothetical protein
MSTNTASRITALFLTAAVWLGGSAAWAGTNSGALDYYRLTPSETPCRLLDTRVPSPSGGQDPDTNTGTPLTWDNNPATDDTRDILVAGVCGVASNAKAVSVTLTALNSTHSGNIVIYEEGIATPLASMLNFNAGENRASNAQVPISATGKITVLARLFGPAEKVHFVLDVTGYYALQGPVVTTTAGAAAFTEDGPPVIVDPGITVTDVASATLASATVTINNLLDSGAETLAANTAGTSIAAVYAAPTLTLSGSDTLANYQQVLRTVTYSNSSQDPDTTSRGVDFAANDGATASNTATRNVDMTALNDAPVLTAGGGTAAFTEGGAPVVVDPGLLVTDVDDTNLASATVTITNLLDSGAELLAASTAGTSITAVYAAPTLTLTGSDTLANYRQVLRSVTYDNTSLNPNNTTRSVSFTVNDGTDASNTVATDVTIAPTDNAPVLTAGGGSPTFTEDGPAVTVDGGILVADADDTNLVSATVTITNLLNSGAETLAANTAGTSITAVYAAPTLTLTGSDTLANYQQVLRTVTYANSSQNPTTTPRVVAFVANDGTSNSNTVNTTVNLSASNDAPVLTAGGGSPTFTEGGPAVAVDPGLLVADVDNANLVSATVTITNLLDSGAETLAATTAGTSITAVYAAPVLTLTGSDTLANYQQVLRSVTYANSSEDPSTTGRVISFVANDGTVNSNTVTTTVNCVAVNDPPVLTAGGGSPTFTEDGPPVTVDGGILVTDADDTNLVSATVTITNLLNSGAETLAANTAGTSITAAYVAPVLTLTGSDTLANYQQVLRSVTYNNTSQNPNTTSRVISFVVNDGTANSNPVTTTVAMASSNDAPVLTSGGGSPAFTEDGPAVTVDGGILVTDADSTNLASATVTITNLLNSGAETLAANTAGTSITASYVAPVLTLSGADTVANYQQVLRTVTYNNTSQNPSTTPRVVSFVVNDGTANSNTVTKNVSVAAVNDAPVLTSGGGSPAFVEDGPAVTVDGGILVADADNANLVSATVTITNLLNAGAEVLAANTAGTSITAAYVAPVLTLTGSDTLANYQQVLRSVTYNNTSQSPNTTPRAISFVANDGTANSNTVTKNVGMTAVNDAPVLTAGGGSPTFTEDGPAVAVDPGLLVTDVDNANLASATVTITNLLDSGAETLAANTAGTSITASYVAPTLTLSGSDTVANYRQVLRSVTYSNSSNNPSTTARVISFQANDGLANSNTVTTSVGVVAAPDAPLLAAGGGPTPTFTEDGPAVVVDSGIGVTDADSANLASATVTITNLLNAGAEILTANTAGTSITASYVAPVLTLTGSDTLANYQQVLRTVAYNNTSQNPSTTPRVIAFVANDGAANSNTLNRTVNVVAVNDAPVLTPGGGPIPTFTEDGPAATVDSGISASDVDNANLASGTVTITNLLNAGAEFLAANTAGTSITASYAAPTLTLSGSDTKANYQQVLRTVTYNNTSQNPNATNRSISFVVNDGALPSNTVVATMQVVPVNDAPTFTTNPITYTTPGNTQLHVAGATLPGVASWSDPQSALAKSVPTDVDGPVAITVVAASGSSVNGGSFSIDTAGKFTYVPPAGFTGTDSFTYQVTDSQTPATGTINITVGQRVWYIRDVTDANNAAGGDGRSTNAFDTIAAFNAATTNNGDIIFVFEGNTATTPLAGGVTLKDGQKLWGQGIALNVPGFGTTLVNATNKPRIQATTASTNVVSVPATAGARNNVEIRGLDLEATGATSNAIDVTASGANLVGVTISDNNVRGATSEGIDLNAGSTATFTVTTQNNTVTSTGNGIDTRVTAAGTTTVTVSNTTISSAANAFDARTQAGASALRVAFDNSTVTAGGTGVLIDGSAAGTTTITGFVNNAVSGNTVGTGIAITSATFDQTAGGTFDLVSGGTAVVGASGNGVGGPGVVLTNVSGNLSYTDLDIVADGGAGLRASSGAVYNGSVGFQLAVGATSSVTAIGGPAVDLSTVTAAMPWQRISSTNSATTGVALNSVAGSFSTTGGTSSISNTTGTGFQAGSSSATISYDGTISTTTGKGVDLTSNSGTISFTGLLTLSSGTNTAFNATGGGTVTVTNTANTLTTTTGTALNVSGTTIGASGLKFRSIASNGGGNAGIVLNNTGTSGGLTVGGNGGTCTSVATCTGGAIQNKTVDGISLNNTRGVSLSLMAIDNNDGSGIFGDDLTDFSLINSRVTNNGDTQNGSEAGLRFNELLGTCAITNSTISGSSEDNIRMTPASGVLTNLAISGSTISSCAAPVACNGLVLIATGTADLTFNVTGSTFQSNKSSAFQINISNNSKANVNVSSSNINDNTLGIDLSNALNADLTFNITGNTLLRQANNAINIISGTTATNAAQLRGTVSGNFIGDNTADSGSRDAFGIGIDADGDVDAIIAVTNNTIKHTDFEGIFAESAFDDDADAETGKLDLTLTGNNVGAPDDNGGFPIGALYGVRLESRRTTNLCLDISGNTAASTGGLQHFRVRQRDTSSFRLERFAGDGTNDATVAAFIAGQNVGGSTASATHATTYTGVVNGTCRKP